MSDTTSEDMLATWTPPECPFAVAWVPQVFDDIRLAVVDAFYSLPRGGAEIGGILLGTSAGNRVTITEYAQLDCEHAYGPSFTLSPKDHSRLADLMARAKAEGKQVVGWYHSHTRSEIFLNDSDLELHDRYFRDPIHVALVLKPHNFQPMRGGFFFREATGAIQTKASYREFTLDSSMARPSPVPPASTHPPAAEPAEPAERIEPPHRPVLTVDAVLRGAAESSRMIDAHAAVSEPVAAPAAPPAPEPVPIPPPGPFAPPAPIASPAPGPVMAPHPLVPPPVAAPSVSATMAAQPAAPAPPPRVFEAPPLRASEVPPSRVSEAASPHGPEAPAHRVDRMPLESLTVPTRSYTWVYWLLLAAVAVSATYLTRDRWMGASQRGAGVASSPGTRKAAAPVNAAAANPAPNAAPNPAATAPAAAPPAGTPPAAAPAASTASAPATPLPLAPLALAVTDAGGQLRIQWDRAAASVQAAPSGLLEITDGATIHAIPLTAQQVKSGSFSYARQSERVQVKLTVEQRGGTRIQDLTTFLGRVADGQSATAGEADGRQREDFAKENARLKSQLEAQSERTRKLERSLEDLRKQVLRNQQKRRLKNQSGDLP